MLIVIVLNNCRKYIDLLQLNKPPNMNDLGFPIWLRITHWVNAVVMIFLIRSGIQILSDHPKLYWNDDTTPGTEWIKFGKKIMPKDRLWTSLDEAEYVNPVIALPGGHHNLGSGRRWHFLAAFTWVINGAVYMTLILASGLWQRLVPSSWSIIPESFHTFVDYITFHIPPASAFHPYDPLQQLTYFGIVFILAPLMILTGLAMSPAFIARFPWYTKIFGGRQGARSIHFIIMILFVLFIPIHIILVLLVGFPHDISSMTIGKNISVGTGLLLYLGVIGGIVLMNVWATWYTIRNQRRFQLMIDLYFEPLIRKIFGRLRSKQNYTKNDISPFFRVNGYPPKDPDWITLSKDNFKDWKLKITGLEGKDKFMTLEDLKKLPKSEQITKHNCIQGWSAIAQWGGITLSDFMKNLTINPRAKYIVFYAYDRDQNKAEYYSSVSIKEATYPQSLLAYEMNWNPLPIEHGAPIRLRMESKLGFKMVKYIKEISFVENIRDILAGRGGYREDNQYFDVVASI